MKDLLKLLDLSREEIVRILDVADQMKYDQKHRLPHPRLQGKTLAMIFEKNSTRTRVSFETGMFQLGGHALFLSGRESQIGRGEPVEDTARVLSRYCDGIMIRTYSQEEVEKLARYADIPVINGLTDFAHPCQVLADLMTIRERKARLEGLKMCFIGDGNNMVNSLIVGCLKVGMEVSVACPEGYDPHPDVLAFAREAGHGFSLVRDPLEAAAGVDVVFTDVWASMGQEEEAAQRRAAFRGYQVNEALMAVTDPGCMVQHCLPAHRGEEITAEVFEAHAGDLRRGREPPPRPEGRPLSPDGRGRPVNGRPSLRSSLLKEMHGSSHTERRPRAALCAVRGRLCVRACVVSGQAAPVQKRTRMAAAWARVAPPPGFRAAGPVPLMRPPA